VGKTELSSQNKGMTSQLAFHFGCGLLASEKQYRCRAQNLKLEKANRTTGRKNFRDSSYNLGTEPIFAAANTRKAEQALNRALKLKT